MPCCPLQDYSRILALHVGVNVFRLLRLLARHVGDARVPLGGTVQRSHGVSITFKMDSVVKQIVNFEQQPNVNPNLEDLTKVGLASVQHV